jgi:hypothetical protein
MKKNLLVTLADDNYVDYAKQVFASAYWKGGWEGDYMLLAYKVSEEKLNWFIDKGIIVKRCDDLEVKIHESSKFSEVVLNKFKIFTPEFKKWNKVLFLDVDTMIRYDLSELDKKEGFNAVSEFFPFNPLKASILKNEESTIQKIKEEYGEDSVCKPWLKDSYFYNEWKENFDRADLIKNFNIINHDIKKFGFLNKVKYHLYYLYRDLFILIDRNIGKLGIFLRKVLKIQKNEK